MTNQTCLRARLFSRQLRRYTPAGEPSVRLGLTYEGQVVENGLPRTVKLDIQALALGDLLVTRIESLALDSELTATGFLSNGLRGKGIVLRLTAVEAHPQTDTLT
ncbi:primosomal replication protein N [Amphibiibacter pelophylacis]|uniref:Primosomal replication protein N n=1 Tax=Amphibiibacter pelophylacis TaxID=1799477 RepID=A0ACC6P398_9BURK